MKVYQLTDPSDVLDREKTPRGTLLTEVWPGGSFPAVTMYYRRPRGSWKAEGRYYLTPEADLSSRMEHVLSSSVGAVVMVYVPEETD